MNKIRAKAIKLYWNIAKERCPFHEEEMVNSFLEGFIDCAEYLLLQNTELKAQIEKMKRCEICEHSGTYLPVCYSKEPCKNKDKFELRR